MGCKVHSYVILKVAEDPGKPKCSGLQGERFEDGKVTIGGGGGWRMLGVTMQEVQGGGGHWKSFSLLIGYHGKKKGTNGLEH